MTTCEEWPGAVSGVGYGQRWAQGRVVSAHRFAWEEAHGPIPEGLCVLHHCDNRRCIRVDHLFLGTRADNSLDMVRKGRARGGRPEVYSDARHVANRAAVRRYKARKKAAA